MDLINTDLLLNIKEFSEGKYFVIIISIILLQIISASFFLPCGYIPILSGALLGFEAGGFVAAIAQSFGSNTTFYLGRYVTTISRNLLWGSPNLRREPLDKAKDAPYMLDH